MALYIGSQKVKPSGISKIYAGSTLVYEASGPTPAPYRKLEYIEANDHTIGLFNIHLDFGYNYSASNTDMIEVDYQLTTTIWGSDSTSKQWYGAWLSASNADSRNGYVAYYNGNYNNILFRVGAKSGSDYYDATAECNNTNRHTFGISAMNAYVDGVNKKTLTSGEFNATYLSLFCQKYNNNEPSVVGKLYNFAIYSGSGNNKVYSHNLIPCQRKSDNVIGLMDEITGTFYTNYGSGTFIAGPTVQENWYPINV